MLMVGLTGGIGSGKSAVSGLLAGHGAIVIDADAMAREVVAPGTPGLSAVVEAFGADVLQADGNLDREALGKIVFVDPEARRRLESITHPLIRDETVRRFTEVPPEAVVVHDVPLLVETGAQSRYEVVLAVETPRDVRLTRLADRGLPRDQAEARMSTQASDAERRAAADVVIDNSGTRAELAERVAAVWADLLARRDAKAAAATAQ